jgi:hypothetical protein
LQELLTFVPEERPDESAKKLATLVLEAGLKLSNEQFVHLFEQVRLRNNTEGDSTAVPFSNPAVNR